MIDTQAPEQVQDPEVSFEQADIDPTKLDLTEEVIQLNRVAKVVKGGRRFSFSALVVVGDKNGHVGLGFGKANEVPESIRKAVDDGKKNLIYVPRIHGTIPYRLVGEFGAGRVLLRPASEGTGLIAGPAVRSVLELAGIHNLLTKSLGCSNVVNILKAVMRGLESIRDAEQVARLRGKKLEEIVGPRRAQELRESTRASQMAPRKAERKTDRDRDRAPQVAKPQENPADAAPAVEMAESTPPTEVEAPAAPVVETPPEAAPAAPEAAPPAPPAPGDAIAEPQEPDQTPPAQA